jgi:hypothetical protein
LIHASIPRSLMDATRAVEQHMALHLHQHRTTTAFSTTSPTPRSRQFHLEEVFPRTTSTPRQRFSTRTR